MKFSIKKPSANIINIARRLGYRLGQSSKQGEFSCHRPLRAAPYPRFHLYIKQKKQELIFNLHLDQKKPSYAGARAHSGQYQGPIVEAEGERIKNILA